MTDVNARPQIIHRIRTEQGRYYFAAGLTLMLASVAFRVGQTGAGVALLAAFPLLLAAARFERLVFDGVHLRRSGPYAWLQSRLLGAGDRISPAELELVLTEAVYLPLSGARHRFRTIFAGANFEAVVFSNAAGYPRFMAAVCAATDETKLDLPSLTWRRYGPPPPSAIIAATRDDDQAARLPAALVRYVANHLTLTGDLKAALRCFKDVYARERGNPQLLCEMGYFFRRLAAEHPRRRLRAGACLRLAARLGRHEPRLLERIGEAYCELLDFVRAERCFRRAVELDRGLFRAYAGLAELAFRDGRLASVAYYYDAAAQGVADAALRRRAQREARYYERLSRDDDYLEAEVRRITLLHQIRQMRTAAGYVFFVAWLIVGVAGRFSPDLQDGGLAAMGSSGLVWLGLSVGLRRQRKRVEVSETMASE